MKRKRFKSKRELISKLPDDTSEAVNEVVKYVNEHPDEASSILQTILNKKGISNDVFKDASIEISKDDNIPNKAIVEAVEKNDVPDKMISGILHEGEFGTETTGQLIDQIDDENIRKQTILRTLASIYGRCNTYLSDEMLIESLNNIGINGKNYEEEPDVALWVKKIISKKMAINFSRYGFSKVFVFSDFYSPEKMIEINLQKDIMDEYEKIGYGNNDKVRSDVVNAILEAIAVNVAKNYQETESYIIPQVKNLNNISKEEEEEFIRKIAIKSKNELSQAEIKSIKSQIEGKTRNVKSDQIIFNQLVESGVIDVMEGLSDSDRKGAINIIKESLERSISKRKEAENSGKIKDARTGEIEDNLR